MKKILTIFFLLTLQLSLYAQIDTLWEKCFRAGNSFSWFSPSGNTERGLAYGLVNGQDRLYVVSRNGSLNVYILNANTGEQVGNLPTTGISGGVFLLNDIEVTDDGVILGINLTNDASAIKIYKWVNESSAPVVVFENNLNGVIKRVGDNFKVVGKINDNSAKIWFADQANKKVYVLGTNDFGNSFAIETVVTLPSTSIDNMPSVYPINNQSFVLNSNGKYVTKWDLNGTLLGTIPGSQVGVGSNSIQYFEHNGVPYIFTFQHGGATTENARLVMVGNDFSKGLTYIVTPSLFLNNNPNGTGDVDIKFNNDGSQMIYVLSTNNGIGAYKVWYPFLINGRINEKYDNYHPDLDNNAGFGPAINIDGIFAHIDNEFLYLASDCYLNTSSSDGIVLFLGISKLTGLGAAAGTPLGNITNGGHLFGATTNGNFKNDFETHYGFVINPGSSNTSVYLDAVKYSTSGNSAQYIGMANQTGAIAEGPETDGIFTNKSIKFAFYNDHDINRGWELKIPLNQIGNPTALDEFKLFAAVVSSTAYFSDVTVPGTITNGNLGFNPNFSTLSGGPFHMNTIPLPVELVSFSANIIEKGIYLNWKTATELNNYGFEILRSEDNLNFVTVGFVKGNINSSQINEYSFVDYNVKSGKYFYKLKQIDLNGSYSFSNVIEVNTLAPKQFNLEQNFPNPFNPSTQIKFSVEQTELTKLTVYNSLGEEIAVLFNQVAEKGTIYQITFNSNNLSSGTYFYRLTQGDKSITKKMLLIK